MSPERHASGSQEARDGGGTAHCPDRTASASPGAAQRAVTLPDIPPVRGARHRYAFVERADRIYIEERDLTTGGRRAYPVTPGEVEVVASAPAAERDAIAWRLYHLCRIRTGGLHGQEPRR